MADNKIFFSYSRDNSEFVIELAKELREAGATIWLDQLDIKPGTRWDRSIEEALKSSNTLLVILSKSSVESNNVMDEVSYALEESRTVVPVLLEECDIPFRLRRLQYADFSQSNEKGIQTLIKALNLESDVADKLVDIAKEAENSKNAENKPKATPVKPKEEPKPKADPIATPFEEPKVVTPKPETPKQPSTPPTPATPAKKSNSKLVSAILGALVVGALIYFVPKLMNGDEATVTEDTSNIENTETPTISPPENGGTNTDEPVEIEISAEDKAWEVAKIKGSVSGYIDFMEQFPEGDDAKFAEIENWFLEFLPNEGYIQYSQSNGTSYFNQLYVEEDNIPTEGDIIEAAYARNIKAGPYGTTGFSKTLKVIRPGEVAVVLDVIESGSAYWVQIRY